MSSKSGDKRTPLDDSEDDDDDFEEDQPVAKKRKKHQSLIDDAAEESGDEMDDEDEDEEDGINDYVEDDFVTSEVVKEKRDVLEDSDDEQDDDDESPKKKRGGRIRKLNEFSELTEDDKMLIAESRGEQPRSADAADEGMGQDIYDDADEGDVIEPEQSRRRPTLDDTMDDDMDDFIEDDIGDQVNIRRADKHSRKSADDVNEAQLNEASEIFGTEYLDFLRETDEPDDDEAAVMGRNKFSEGMDSDEEVISSDDDDDDDDDLFGDDADESQKAQALRLRREKRKLSKEQRKREAAKKKAEKRQAQLRRAFEPVRLIENFCTAKDDAIREADIPERYFDLHMPAIGDDIDDEATWIASRVPGLSPESPVDCESIKKAIGFLCKDKLEPAFVKLYRQDYILSTAVKENLYDILDQHGEWSHTVAARSKVESALNLITASADANESVGETSQRLAELEEELNDAKVKLADTAKQEAQVKAEVGALGENDNDDDDDDELFGADDDDNEDDDDEKKRNKKRLHSHLATVQSLLEARAEKVSSLESNVQAVREQTRALTDPGPLERISRKTCRDKLWNSEDYAGYLSNTKDSRHIVDLNSYLNLLKEGNEAIRKKEMPQVRLGDVDKGPNRRSRRFDRDFYRTCVSEGLRSVCYRFLLPPNRVGIKLEATINRGNFEFTTKMPGDEDASPMQWVPPTINSTPHDFCSDLIGSGDLVLLDADSTAKTDLNEGDSLRGCRYVAAMELAHEPRVRRSLREIYRKHALLTTVPTKKGLTDIDAFHSYYGLHLIRDKPVKEHFPPDGGDVMISTLNMNDAEKAEYHREMKKRETDSCLQYLNILKATATRDVMFFIHLPLEEVHADWYKDDTDNLFGRSNQVTSSLLKELHKVYMPTDTDSAEWEKERESVLNFALTTFLLPLFEKEVRKDLREAATKAGIAAAGEKLKTLAMEGPYRPAEMLHTSNRFLEPTGDLQLVGVCCSSDNREATYLASVSTRGESTDYLAIPGGVQIDSHKWREKVVLFFLQSRPDAVIVGSSGGGSSRSIQRKTTILLEEAMNRWKHRNTQGDDEDDDAFEERQNKLRLMQPAGQYDDDDEDWTSNVELVDDSIAQLFGRSVRGTKEFPEYSVNLKCAIASARFAKDPLGELTYTWSVASDMGTFGTEMFFLNIHPMQQLLPRTMLLRHYERVLCEAVASVGCDINACCELDHLRGLLLFVPGLGPRKAANLKQAISKMGGAIAKRRDLLENRHLGIGPIVYNNAVGFLKIRDVDQLADQVLHPLDETRLHPDVYSRNNWAVKIALDALERVDARGKDSAGIKALRDVMDNSRRELERLFVATKSQWVARYGSTFNVQNWDPRVDVPAQEWNDKVEELDLESFAKIIDQQKGQGKWYSHLEMIKWEFRLPFADPRKPMQPLSGDRFFQLITGESDETLRPGKEVTGKVLEVGDFGSKVKLDGDIRAFIPLKNLSDDHAESAHDYVTPGQIITAVVTEVKKDHMSVDMSLKESDFRKKLSSWERPASLEPFDRYFDTGAASTIEDDNKQQREAHIETIQRALGTKADEDATGKRKGRVVNRACTHPNFRNMRNDEVDRILKEGGEAMVGEALIRPSSKSSESLAVHWLFKKDCIRLIEVIEEDKESDTSIGKTLKIKTDKYSSIEEMLVRHIAPMNEFVDELVSHRKFMQNDEEAVDEKLKAQKQAVKASIPYALCWLEQHPGYVSLRFISTQSVRHHLIAITPRGFSWEGSVFPTVETLLNNFKKNPQGPRGKKSSGKSSTATEKPSTGRGRWGDKAAPARPPPPPVPRAQYAAPPAPLPQWNRPPPPQAIPVAGASNAWGQTQPRPPQRPPPPPRPPAYGQPSQPILPPPPPRNPPVPPPYKNAFEGAPVESQGRGRGRTLPAWMSKG